MNISTVQSNNINFCCLNKPHKRLTVQELKNIWLINDYVDWATQQPAKKLPNILIAQTKQAFNRLFRGFWDIEQAKSDISKPFVNLLLNK